MVRYLLDGIENNSVQLMSVQSLLIVYLSPEQYQLLTDQIYQRLEKIQKRFRKLNFYNGP